MKSIPIPEEDYQQLESISEQTGQPLTELVRQLLNDYLSRKRKDRPSLSSLSPHPSGPLLGEWSRADLLDEMLDR